MTVLIIVGAVLLLAAVAVIALSAYSSAQMKKVPSLSSMDCIKYSLEGRKDGVITVGIIKDGVASYKVYGEDGRELANTLHTYEIGSLTKTFTAAMIKKAANEGLIDLNASISDYLPLPSDRAYPTVARVLTHTSGLAPYYLATPMIGNHLAGRNDFYSVTGEMVLDELKNVRLEPREYPFQYSNFGYAVLGLILENVYNEEYSTLFASFAGELGLDSTYLSDGSGDLGKLWAWKEGDAYIPAGAVLSNIEDMLKYAKLLLSGDALLSSCQDPIITINATTPNHELMDIRLDKIGMAWITDDKNSIVWHNGGTTDYNSYLGIDRANNTAVVLLSNLPHNYKLPVTVAGVKLILELRGE